jgi:hypothetical protein
VRIALVDDERGIADFAERALRAHEQADRLLDD